PGGWLFVEEIDAGSVGATDPGHPRAAEFDRTARALWATKQATGPIDSTFGRRVPALVERFGIRELRHDGVTMIRPGGVPPARCPRMTEELLRGRFVAAGVLTEADFAERYRAYDDPSFWFTGFTFFGAWGRRPGERLALND